jgi:hypothetical protein
MIPLIDLLKGPKEKLLVPVIYKDRLPCIATGGHMVDSAIIFYSQCSCHDCVIAPNQSLCNEQGPLLYDG